ncbi:MAG: hypothetical protein ACNA8G_06030 [Gammaproteobacteria bacterium]
MCSALPALLLSAVAQAGLQFHWQDAFTVQEQAKLRAWIEETHAALQDLVGPMPFDVHVFMHRRDGASEPVPWANTQRSRSQGVHFHVDPRYPLASFRRDWTAAHELSHLVLPYLGTRHAWFSEGFASYLQYQVMHAQGVLSAQSVARRYRRNLERAARSYPYPSQPFARAAPRLRAEGKYPTMYWGGAVYFLQVNEVLQHRSGLDLRGVLRDYVACCHERRSSLPALVAELDRVAGSDAFSRELRKFEATPGFPRYGHLELRPR